MPPTTESVRRRSQRLSRSLPVVVCGESPTQKPFREEALTVEFNAHGALLVLYAKVELGQKLILMNPTTWDDQEARVVYSCPFYSGLTRVGIEFMRPAPAFWPINNPPGDWNLASTA
jgi:hypothetical protein